MKTKIGQSLLTSAFLAACVLNVQADTPQEKLLTSAGAEVSDASGIGLSVEFHLTHRSLIDSDLAVVEGMDNITLLNLKGTRITGDGLQHLSKLTGLRVLHLEKTKVDDEGMRHISVLSNLQYLNIFGTKVTDDAIPHLIKLQNLRVLYTWQTRITKDGAARLQRAIPGLKVVRGIDLDKIALDFPVPDEERPPTKELTFISADNISDAPKSGNGDNIEVFFENQSKRKIKIYWVGYGGELKLYGELAPGGKRTQNSYAKNTWLITDTADQAIGYFICSPERAKAIIPDQN
ncbi:MAG TPA: hypothetical protein DCP67_00875 [Planctomycetaceae bacterium]|nr:hypothetical protein [Planctomycetaceae bacterium]